MKAVLLLSIIPFFFLLLLIPTYAYITPDMAVNIPNSYVNERGLRCSNITGTLYCYWFEEDQSNHWGILFRANATGGNVKYCIIGTGLNYQSIGGGFAIANETHIIQRDSTAFLWNHMYYVPVWSMDNSTTCTRVDSGYTMGYYRLGAYYDINGDQGSGWTYFGLNVNAVNSTTMQTVGETNYDYYVSVNNLTTFSFPDIADNETAFAMNGTYGTVTNNVFFEFRGGALYGLLPNYCTLYNVCGTSIYYDFYKENASTTWLYVYKTDWLYRMNWTAQLDDYSNTTTFVITPVEPLDGTTTYDSPEKLTVSLTTDMNGSLTFFFNGSLISGVNYTINTIQNEDQYSAVTGSLTNGESYTWFARFTSGSDTWVTNNQTFTYNLNSYDYLLSNPMNGFALLIGSAFSTSDLDASKEISSVILSFVISIMIVLGIGIVGKGKMHSDSLLTTFGLSLIAFMSMFALMGWFPAWFIIILLVIGAYAFMKIGKIGD